MHSSLKVISGVLVAAFLIHKAEGIRCYHCNSANNSACFDVRAYDRFNIVPLVHCESAVPEIGRTGAQFFCRKIIQTILNPGHDSEVRITRGCGWVPHKRECYKADNDGHLETVCQCTTDRCNSTARPNPSAAILALLSTLTFILAGTRSIRHSN